MLPTKAGVALLLNCAFPSIVGFLTFLICIIFIYLVIFFNSKIIMKVTLMITWNLFQLGLSYCSE